MALILKSPPSLAEISKMLDEVKDHLRKITEPGPEDPQLSKFIKAAFAMLDGPESKTRRALLSQTWVMHLDALLPEIPLRLPPVQSVTSVKYRAPDGTTVTMDPDKYRLISPASWDPVVSPEYGETWPETQQGSGAVEIEFIAGYGPTLDDIPAPLHQAIRMTVGEWFETREGLGWSTPVELPHGVRTLIQPYRIYR